MPISFGTESQREAAERMYNSRAPAYESSWHPAYARRFAARAPIRTGDRVLDLCCGTGLEAFLAADAVGDGGEVVGVDVAEGMLAQLHARLKEEEKEEQAGLVGPGRRGRIRTARHDVTDLDGLAGEAGVVRGSFDVVLCSCAFVLLHDPARVVAHWREFLKPGGAMAIDVTHEHNLRAGLVLEKVAREMGVDWPSNRLWVESEKSFRDILEAHGMEVESVTLMENVAGRGTQLHGVEKADELFDTLVKSSLTVNSVTDDFEKTARPLFRREWERAAVDGKIEEVDSVYLYVARRIE